MIVEVMLGDDLTFNLYHLKSHIVLGLFILGVLVFN